MKIEAFKHSKTGRIFETKEKFEKFTKEYNEGQKIARERAAIKKSKEDFKNAPRMTATSIEDFRLKAIEMINSWNKPYGVKLLELNFENVKWNVKVSNSHSAPIGYQQNWCGNKDKDGVPNGYPGWEGRVTGKYSKDVPREGMSVSGSFCDSGIPGLNTGTGGGFPSFGYDLKLFLYDFPLIHEQFKAQLNNREELVEKIRLREAADKQWESDQFEFVSSNAEYKHTQSLIDDYTTQITKLTEAKKLCEASLATTKVQLQGQYEELKPHDHTLITQLRQQLQYTETKLKDNG